MSDEELMDFKCLKEWLTDEIETGKRLNLIRTVGHWECKNGIEILIAAEGLTLTEARARLSSIAETGGDRVVNNANLYAALEAVEWEHDYAGDDYYCPWCHNEKSKGHKSDCARQLAMWEAEVKPCQQRNASKLTGAR